MAAAGVFAGALRSSVAWPCAGMVASMAAASEQTPVRTRDFSMGDHLPRRLARGAGLWSGEEGYMREAASIAIAFIGPRFTCTAPVTSTTTVVPAQAAPTRPPVSRSQ